MKTPIALLTLALAFVSSSQPCLFAAEAGSQQQGPRMPPETFDAKVIKVFAAKDGEAIFRAYVVRWKDQEVVVSDPLAKSDFKEGDIITVLAMNHPFPQGREPYRLLGFTIASRRP